MAKISNRPGTVTAAAILLFILGGFSILGGCCGATFTPLMTLLPQPVDANGKRLPDINRRLNELVPHKLYVEASFQFVTFLLGAAKVFAGLSVLRLASSARFRAIAVASATIFLAIAENLYFAIFVVPVIERAVQDEIQNAGAKPPGFDVIEKIMTMAASPGSAWIGIVVGILTTLAIWLTVIFLVNTARARAAFAQGPITELPEDGDIRRSRYEGYDDDGAPAPKSPPDTDRS